MKQEGRLRWALVLCSLFLVAECLGGWWSGSLAIITDALHLLGDMAAYAISLLALHWAKRPATNRLSYGYQRAEILGALGSLALIWALTGYLLVEAVARIRHPVAIDGRVMLVTAAFGVLVNLLLILVLGHNHALGGSHSLEDSLEASLEHICIDAPPAHYAPPAQNPHLAHNAPPAHYAHNAHNIAPHAHEPAHAHAPAHAHSPNLRAALIHAIGDLCQSVGVLIASGVIWWRPDWQLADPLCTFLFSLIVLISTLHLTGDLLMVLMEACPTGIEAATVQTSLLGLPGVLEVHDLHIWSLAPGRPTLTVHLVAAIEESKSESAAVGLLPMVQRLLAEKHGIKHATIQIEPPALRGCTPCNTSTSCLRENA